MKTEFNQNDYEKVLQHFKNKYGNDINLNLFNLCYQEALNKNQTVEQMIHKIDTYIPTKYVVRSSSLPSLLFKEFINNKSYNGIKDGITYLAKEKTPRGFEEYGIKWSGLLPLRLKSPSFAKTLADHITGQYNLVEYEKDNASHILDLNTLLFLANNKEIELNDLQLNVFNEDNNHNAIGMKNLLTNKVGDKEYLIIQSSYMNFSQNDFATKINKWKIIDAACTVALSDKKLDGISFINRDSNAKFSVINKDFNQIRSQQLVLLPDAKGKKVLTLQETPMDYTGYLFTSTFARDLKEFYSNVNLELQKRGLLNQELNDIVKDDIETRILKHAKDNLETNLDIQTTFKPNSKIKYYDQFGIDELSEEQKQYKFVKSVMPSPSQINSILYTPSVKLFKDVSLAKESDYKELILRKYNLKQEVTKEGKVFYTKNEFDAPSRTRMDFGNQIELDIVRESSYLYPHLKINTDKRTLHAIIDNKDLYFDIDGYIGKDLNNVYQVLEVKNSASKLNFDNPDHLVESYRLQATYYDKLLHPKEGVKFLGCLSYGSQAKLAEINFKPSAKDHQDLEMAIHNYLYYLKKFVKEDYALGSAINNIINTNQEKVLPNAPRVNILDMVASLPDKPYQNEDLSLGF